MSLKGAITIAILLFVIGLAVFFLVYPVGLTPSPESTGTRHVVSIAVSSPTLKPNERIDERYTCEGDDVSPPLKWSGYPADSKSFVVIMEDPDAPGGGFTHWVVYNIPASVSELPEALPAIDKLDNGIYQGINDFGKIGYGGPCPPPGTTHRYFFRVYALDTVLELPPGATKDEVMKGLKDHIIGEGSLMVKYGRQSP